MFNYFRKIDRRINETLNIYQELGKLSQPMFKFLILIISFLVITSCAAILLSIFSSNDDDKPKNMWVQFSLPIIIYGITCPIISTVISTIFRIFVEYQINNIKNKRKYIYKKDGKNPRIAHEIYNITKYVMYSKTFLIIPISCIFFLLPLSYMLVYILIFISIVSCILIRISNYFDNCIELDIINVEKCYENNEFFWRYSLSVQYPNEENRVIKKRFNDFKNLHYKLGSKEKLPTSNWIYSPNNINDAGERGKQLDSYIKTILKNKDTLSNSLFYSFLKDSSKETGKIKNNTSHDFITEKADLKINDHKDLPDENISNLKSSLMRIINDSIDELFILHEINYFSTQKKRFFAMNKKNLYKFRYDRIRKKFFLRILVPLKYIKNIEKSVIKNTTYFKDKDVLIITFIYEGQILQFTLISSTQTDNFSIDGFYDALNKYNPGNITTSITQEYNYNNGYGISEELFNNNYVKDFKNVISQKCIALSSYFN